MSAIDTTFLRASKEAIASPTNYPQSPLSQALRQPVLLGLFLQIHHGGWSSSSLPRTTDWSFDYNAKLTKKAEELGFDLVFGYSTWQPKGGQGPIRTEAGLDAFISPRPLYGRPILVNATGSDTGIEFAGRHSDIVFITSPGGGDIESALSSLSAHTAHVKQSAIANGRQVRTFLNPLIVVRETEKEAEEYAQAIIDHADYQSIAGRSGVSSDAHAWRGHQEGNLRHGVGSAIGGNVQLIGSPEQITKQLLQLNKAGVDGFQLAFYDFEPDLDFFGKRVLPLLKQVGLRL
ncbi:MAG: LLM class flavin-dependent oxidoreductase [Nostoc sp.]|uniref:LLM class flavin-dependent oxidoreductase n=1 Tax=Nostoc sp. TaxID=1180 RepID=UPI002FF843EC